MLRLLSVMAVVSFGLAIFLIARAGESSRSQRPEGPVALFRVNGATTPFTVTGVLPSEEERDDLLDDLAKAFPGTGIDHDIDLDPTASTLGWPRTMIPLFSTVRDYVDWTAIEIDGASLRVEGYGLLDEEELVLGRLLGSAPGLTLEADVATEMMAADELN